MAPVVSLNKIGKKEYSMFLYLRKMAPNANIDTLKQISVYIAVTTNDSFDIDRSCDLKSFDNSKEDECFLLSILDGRKIFFSNNSKAFGFSILNYNIKNHIFMSSEVYEKIVGDLSTLTVYSQIDMKDFGRYVVTFRPNNMCDETVKFGTINYYTTEEVNWVYEISDMDDIKRDFDIVAKNNGIYPFTDKMFFDIPLEDFDTELDCYDGCLRNYLSRVDLLYNNLLVYMNTDEKKKIRKM
jgi:hypothetical protein